MYSLEIEERAIINKISRLFEELKIHPETGTGKPEQLKGELSGYWSRRINQEHRLIYTIGEDTVTIYSLKGHYNK